MLMFYIYEKHHIIDNQNNLLRIQSAVLVSEFKELHYSQELQLTYPKHKEFQSAIYDVDSKYLLGDFHPKSLQTNNEFWQEDTMLVFLHNLSPYYLGAAFIVTQKPLNTIPLYNLRVKLIILFVITIIFISLIAYLLGKLFLAPMRQSIKLLDEFIKDATHELNTPVSTILANAELLKSFYPELQESKELQRIEIASKRLSRIYDDLAYVRLNHQRHRTIELINISQFIKERVDYFKSIAKAKQIDFTHDITDNINLNIDREDIARIIDNLLGNAFKYTASKGTVKVVLNQEYLSIEDNGIGIDESSKEKVLERFVRANKSEGGFGLGLSIVADIANYYRFDIKIQTKLKHGTKVSILWTK